MREISFNKEDFDRIFGVPVEETKDHPALRNAVLEEVARELERMHDVFGDTADSFAIFVRRMKT